VEGNAFVRKIDSSFTIRQGLSAMEDRLGMAETIYHSSRFVSSAARRADGRAHQRRGAARMPLRHATRLRQ
jgi:hypothetical protein